MKDTTLIRLRIAAAITTAAITTAAITTAAIPSAAAEDAASDDRPDPEPAITLVDITPGQALTDLQRDYADLSTNTPNSLCVPYATLVAAETMELSLTAFPSAGVCPPQLPSRLNHLLRRFEDNMNYSATQRLTSVSPDGTPLEADTCCYSVEFHAKRSMPVRGRPLIDDHGAAVVASTDTADASAAPWLLPRSPQDLTPIASLPADARAWLASQWLHDGLCEHASIASFARASLELMTLGAPPDLLARVHAAAIDEIDHARRCFSLATAYAGRPLTPGPLTSPAPRALTLAALAVDTFLEACVGESTATLQATRQRRLASPLIPNLTDTLDVIIDDESNHAVIAWQTVAWAISLGGAPVKTALRDAALHAAPQDDPLADVASSIPASLTPALLAAHGRLTPAAEAQAQRDAWREVISPTLNDLLAA